ncbi:MAG: hypothetical protein J2P57_11940 [Acidimicrobiaceae bacterium]|nr:hypothetical protein [Acidimicrobiaceae bacterium]
MAVLILANFSALADAAQGLRGASNALAPHHAVPSTGDGEADGALSHLSSVLQAHSVNLSQGASDASRAMEGFILSFHESGG